MNADLRQAIVLEMQAKGTDALSLLNQALEELHGQVQKAATDFESDLEPSAAKTVATISRLTKTISGLEEVQRTAIAAQEGLVESIGKVDVGWAKLVVSGFKLQDQIRKVAEETKNLADKSEDLVKIDVALNSLIVSGLKFQDALRKSAEAIEKIAEEAPKIDVALNALAVSGLKFQDVLRESVITIGQLTDSAQKLKSDKIDQFHDNTQKLTHELESTVISTDQLAASAQKLKSDKVDQFYQSTAKLAHEFEATVVSTDQLVASAQKLKSDQIQNFYVATDKLQKSLEATVIPLEHLIMSGLKLQDPKNLGGFSSTADAAADKAKKFGYGMMSVAYALDDVKYGIGNVVNNVPGLAFAFGLSPVWAANVAIAAAAVNLLGSTMQPVAEKFARDWGLMIDHTKDFVTTIDTAKVKLDALKDKPFKIKIDYDEIDNAERQLDKMQQQLSAFNAGKNNNLTEEASRQAKEATNSYAGGTEALEKVVFEQQRAAGLSTASGTDLDKLKELKKRVDEGDKKKAEDPTWNWSNRGYADYEQAKTELAKLQHTIDEADREASKKEVGKFQLGDFDAIRRMQNRARNTPGVFNRVGPGGVTAGEAIANLPSSPEETLRRIDEDKDAKDREEHEAELTRNLAESRRRKARKEAEVEAAVEQARRDANVIGSKQEQGKKKSNAERKAQDERVRAAEMEAADLVRSIDGRDATARQKQVSKLAPGFIPQAEAFINQNRLAQVTNDPSMMREADVKAMLQSQASQLLRQGGQDPGLAPDLVSKAFENSNTAYAKALGETGNNVQALIQITNASFSLIEAQQNRIQSQANQIAELRAKAMGLSNAQARGRTQSPTMLPTY